MSVKTKNRSSQRRGRQMARTNKIITTEDSDGHLGRRKKLEDDSRKQLLGHTNKVREDKGLSPLSLEDPALVPGSQDDAGIKTLDEKGDEELVREADLIMGLRIYERADDGNLVGRKADEDEFCALHRKVRRERKLYRELNGSMVQVGDVRERFDKTGKRKEMTRKAPGVLKSIMVRLMPHEAVAATDRVAGLAPQQLESAIDETASIFGRATGCEVVTAVAHKMSTTDCHIHIQYTMVQALEESKHMLGRRMKPWKAMASEMARASLAEEEILDPAPAAIGARKKQLIADGKISPPPEAGTEFCKLAGLRDLGDGAILGYSFRQKLNLVRAAEAGGEKELAEQVTRRNDERFGRFAPIASWDDADLDVKYLDLWLEREWRRNVTSRLPDDIQVRLVSDGVSAARDYAAFGTTIVEEEHIKRRAKELEAKEKDLLKQSEALRGEALKATAREEKAKLEIAKAQKSADEANAQAESLSIEVDELRDKANLFDQVASLLAEVLDLPGVGLIARKMTTLWKKLEKIAPHIGLVNKLAAIAAVRSVKPSKPDPDQNKPGNRG